MRSFIEDIPVLALKISKRGVEMYLGPPCYGYALNCICLFCNTRDTSVTKVKVKFVCIIYMQPQKVKFKSGQINMKHVSYVS